MTTDIREICIEEIALEGLEGITIPTLWLRFEKREPALPYQLNDALKEFLWRFIVHYGSFNIQQIPKDRDEPQIFDRFENKDSSGQTALARAPDELGCHIEIYSTDPLVGVEGVRGACSDFHERLDIKEDISGQSCTLDESLKLYGKKRLVVVASQRLREDALLTGNLCSIVLRDLTDIAYCVLEHIGRSRWQGDMQSSLGKLNFGDKNAHIHYIIDNLYKGGLIVKNNHTYRCPHKNRNIFQILVLLTKFKRECVTFTTRAVQVITNILKESPNLTANMGELREQSLLDVRAFKTACQALKKSGDVIIHDNSVGKRARTLFEKTMTLINHSTTTVATQEDEDDEDLSRIMEGSFSSNPIVFELPVLYQAYQFALKAGATGVTQRDVLGFLKGFGKLEARNICNLLTKMKLVSIVLVDQGKQRVQTYILKNLSEQNLKSLEFTNQRKKMQQLLVDSTKFSVERDESLKGSQNNETIDSIISSIQEESSTSQNSELSDLTIVTPGVRKVADGLTAKSRSSRLTYVLQGETTSNSTHMKKWDANLTTRKLKRHNVILQQLNKEKIIEGFRSIQASLTQFEEKEGITTKVDKKTIVRLVEKMHSDGVLQHTVIPITHNDRTENFHFIMALDCPPKLLKFAVDQAKFKLLGDEENRVARMEQKRLKEEMKEERKTVKDRDNFLLDPSFIQTYNVKDDEKLATKLFLPKFKRLRAIHNLLWYLLYGHPKSVDWTPDVGIYDPDEINVYCDEMNWKRFLPPAPIHFFEDLKWLQLGDVAVILPLSVFCQFHRVSCKIDDLEMHLRHEEKRHMLVRHLPQEVRTYLFYKRRYMFSLMICIEQLVFMGLLTIRRGKCGRNINMPKENMMVYVHKNASILDTRSSRKRHIKVEEKPYQKLEYVFNTKEDVESYWYKLQDICVQTRLGFTEYQEPGYQMIKHDLGHTELKKFVATLDESNNKPLDNGEIPGDQRGAAGLDSSMYSYLYRNWRSKPEHHMGSYPRRISENGSLPSNRLPKLRPRILTLEPAKKKPTKSKQLPVSIDQDTSSQESSSATKPTLERNRSKSRGKKRKSEERIARTGDQSASDKNKAGTVAHFTPEQKNNAETTKKQKKDKTNDTDDIVSKEVTHQTVSRVDKDPEVITVSNIGRNESVKGGRGVKRGQNVVLDFPTKKLRVERRRRKNPKPQLVKQGKQKVKYVDKKDLAAIKDRKGRLRVNFSPAEDTLLLVCRIATSLLTSLYWKKKHRPRKQVISWLVVRDVIQQALPESFDKTSYSMNRRTINLMKNPETRIHHDISLADTKADGTFVKTHLPRILDLEFDLDRTEDVFRNLVRHLRERFKTKPGLFSGEIPDTSAALLERFVPKTILRKIGEKVQRRRLFCDKIRNHLDITHATAENMVYIALAMGDAEFSIYQAYKAFEAFPESVLSEVLVLLQASGIVSTKPSMVRRLPFGIRSHRLAHSYSLSLRTATPHEAIDQLSEVMLRRSEDFKSDPSVTAGQVLLYSYLMAKGPVNISMLIPDQVILPEAPNRTLFENQFFSKLEKYRKEIEPNSGEDGNASTSVMAVAACLLRDDLDAEGDATASSNTKEKDDAESDDNKLKVAEILRLFKRHPSYTNWLMLIDVNRRGSEASEASVSKFLNINSSVSPDNVVLNPCEVTVENYDELLRKYSQNENVNKISKQLDSVKVRQDLSVRNWSHQLHNSNEACMQKTIFEIIDNSGELGMTKSEVSDSVELGFWCVCSAIDDLQKRMILFGVGVSEKRYVTYKHVQPWAAKGFHFLGKEANFQSEIDYEISLLQNYGKDQDPVHSNVEERPSRSLDFDGKNVVLSAEATESVMSRYDEVLFISRPWHTIYGSVSFKAAKTLVVSVYLKILSWPGISKEDICGSFSFQKICIIELLEILLDVGCIKESVIETRVKRMFSAPSAKKKTTYYETTQDGLITVGQWADVASRLIRKIKIQDSDIVS